MDFDTKVNEAVRAFVQAGKSGADMMGAMHSVVEAIEALAPVAAPTDLHAAIMRLPCDEECVDTGYPSQRYAYKAGHRDARHAAAELVAAAEDAPVGAELSRDRIATLITQHTGLRRPTFKDEFDELERLVCAVLDEIAAPAVAEPLDIINEEFFAHLVACQQAGTITANLKFAEYVNSLANSGRATKSAPAVAASAQDAERLEYIYQITAVKPFIAPITTKEKWLDSIDAAILAAKGAAA